jgi:hypothetical protein
MELAVAQSSTKGGNDADGLPQKPVPPAMQSVIKGGWTYRVENPTETSVSALKELAQEIKNHSWAFVRSGQRMLSPPETAAREQRIVALAGKMEELAEKVPQNTVTYVDVDAVLSQLREVGFFPDNLLVNNVARAIHALAQKRGETDIGTEQR